MRNWEELPSPLDLSKMEQVMAELDEGQKSCVRSCLKCWQEWRLDEEELLLQLKTLSGQSPTLGDLFRKSDIQAARNTEVASASEMLELMSMFSDIKFLQESIDSRPHSRASNRSCSSRSPVRTPAVSPRRCGQIQRVPSQASSSSQSSQAGFREENRFLSDNSTAGAATGVGVRAAPDEGEACGDVMMSIGSAQAASELGRRFMCRGTGAKMDSDNVLQRCGSNSTGDLYGRQADAQCDRLATLPRENSWPMLASAESVHTRLSTFWEDSGGEMAIAEEQASGSQSPKRARVWHSTGNLLANADTDCAAPSDQDSAPVRQFSASFSHGHR